MLAYSDASSCRECEFFSSLILTDVRTPKKKKTKLAAAADYVQIAGI